MRSDALFDARSLVEDFQFLGKVSPALLAEAGLHPVGELRDRIEGLVCLRDALLTGTLPEGPLPWPPFPWQDSLLATLEEIGVVPFCKGEPEVVERVLLDALRWMETGAPLHDQVRESAAERLAAETAEEDAAEAESESDGADEDHGGEGTHVVRQPEPGVDPMEGGGMLARLALLDFDPDEIPPEDLGLGGGLLARLALLGFEEEEEEPPARVGGLPPMSGGGLGAEEEAGLFAAAWIDACARAAWEETVGVWEEVREAFGDLGSLLGLGWDLARAVLREHGLDEVKRLREILEALPELQELIQELGRLRDPDPDAPPIIETVFDPMRRVLEETRRVRTPHAPHEAHGVERGDALSRMLPSEASLLSHPMLRVLWHARRTDHALLQYRMEGLDVERTSREVDGTVARQVERPQPRRGPILICLDTSGSMQGTPEKVAKALTLEAARVAAREKRRCYLFAFSGPDEVEEHELSLTPEGLPGLLRFLSQSFDGGTDVDAPLRLACGRLSHPDYRSADILLVSDGDFWVDRRTLERLRVARQSHSVKVHGVLIGWKTREMEMICDELHTFSSWDLDRARLP